MNNQCVPLPVVALMTPQEFADKMRALHHPAQPDMLEISQGEAHEEAGELMCELLRSLGYSEGVDMFHDIGALARMTGVVAR